MTMTESSRGDLALSKCWERLVIGVVLIAYRTRTIVFLGLGYELVQLFSHGDLGQNEIAFHRCCYGAGPTALPL